MSRWYWRAIVGVACVGIIAVIVMLALPKPPIPGPIRHQLTSPLMLPNTSKYPVDRVSTKYDANLKQLTYNATVSGTNIVISEQPTPDSFTDVPQVYQKLLTSMADYADFDTGVGTVHLTRPAQLQGKQAAVLNAKGTLLFAKPTADLSEDQWRQFFNSFDVSR